MTTVHLQEAAGTCAGCGTSLSSTLLVCPGCHRLIHAERLKELAAAATAASARGDVTAALAAWRTSLELLPSNTRQYASIGARVAELSETADAERVQTPPSGKWKWLAALGPVGLLLWKFKFVVVALLSKGKLLLLGLTKTGTLMSMFGAVGVYWTVWGVWFALGLVISIYIHEMGHVAALRRYGIRASAPMFVPGLGAFIRMKQAPITPREDARVGLAGPVWGLGAAVVAATGAQVGGGELWLAVARTGAWLNLFNLMPVWQLDGSRAFASLTTMHRWIATGALALAWAITGDGLVLLVLIVAVVRSMTGARDVPADRGALGLFVFVAISLAVIFRLSGLPGSGG